MRVSIEEFGFRSDFFEYVEFTNSSWKEYKFCQKQDAKRLNKINKLIKDIAINGIDKGLGRPEHLKFDLRDFWSREISKKDRLIYGIKDKVLFILKCDKHYYDK
ncbi:MAG: Txe/YoeB family addiction module toxin [Elusimicrobiota bacterium]|jgi:toxin YoeB|nr:Txe/YoeB family addiction module toxin [Elusimicrobiota bacterium]